MFVRDIDIPTYDVFIKFLKGQAKIIQRTNPITNTAQREGLKPKTPTIPKISHAYLNPHSATQGSAACCFLCKNVHEHIYHCKAFLELSPSQRYQIVKEANLCTNCLSSKHKWSACKSTRVCQKCAAKHHSLIHLQRNNDSDQTMNSAPAGLSPHRLPAHSAQNTSPAITCPAHAPQPVIASPAPAPHKQGVSYLSADAISYRLSPQQVPNTTVLLGTAFINVYDRYNNSIPCRAIIDMGSQNNFISSSCCRKLGLNISQLSRKTIIKGLGDHASVAQGKLNITFSSSVDPNITYAMDTLVLNRITEKLPTAAVDMTSCKYLNGLPLADEKFSTPSDIDILIGAQLFVELLLPGKITGSPGQPSAFLTTLGYVIMGEAEILSSEPADHFLSYHATAESIHEDLRKFFELENIKETNILSSDDQECESFYKTTTTRDETGRFIVSLPFKQNPSCLGDSFKTARQQYLHLERKFQKNRDFKSRYDDVIREYISQGYLVELPETEPCSGGFVLPHHGVIRDDKVSSKLRIVLQANQATDNGISLNDILHTGPALQNDLLVILLNFRLFKIAVTADIRQMFLRILTRDYLYQQILYRFDPREPIKRYAFQCVTFGLRSSPFLANRTIRELINLEKERFPLASELALRDLYVDDIASSFMNTDVAVKASQQLIDLFKSGGFDLLKWSSNSNEVLSAIPESHRLTDPVALDKDESLKILGMQWLPASDLFTYTIQPSDRECTKRNILSTIARLWDIMGLVGPVIVYAKILIKEICILKLDWDERPPDNIVRS